MAFDIKSAKPVSAEETKPQSKKFDASSVKAKPAARDEESYARGAGRAFTQGSTFGFGDEIVAGLGGAAAALTGQGNFSDAYQDILEAERAAQGKFAEKNPIASTALELAGGLGTGAGATKLLLKSPAAKLLGKTGAVLTDAAAQGALYGAGSAKEGERLFGAGTGAITSGAMAGATKVAAAVAKPVVEGAANILGLRNPNKVALQKVKEALEKDGMTPDELLIRFKEAQKAAPGKPIALSDIAGDNVRALAKVAQVPPSKAKRVVAEFLEKRVDESGNRIVGDIREMLGTGSGTYGKKLDDIMELRKLEAEPYYTKARAYGELKSPELEKIMKRPYMQHAFKEVVEDAMNEGRPIPIKIKVDAQGMPILDKSGNVQLEALPDLESLDAVKKGLDKLIESNSDPVTGKLLPRGRTYNNLKRDMLGAVDAEVPDYAKARQIWSGHSETMNRMEQGKKFLREDPYEIMKDFSSFSPSEQEAYKIGVLKALQDTVEKSADGRNVARTIFGSERKRQQLEQLFSPAEFQALTKKLELEDVMFANKNPNVSGSQTALLHQGLQDFTANPAISAGLNAARGNWLVAAADMLGSGTARARGFTGDVANEVLMPLYDPSVNARSFMDSVGQYAPFNIDTSVINPYLPSIAGQLGGYKEPPPPVEGFRCGGLARIKHGR